MTGNLRSRNSTTETPNLEPKVDTITEGVPLNMSSQRSVVSLSQVRAIPPRARTQTPPPNAQTQTLSVLPISLLAIVPSCGSRVGRKCQRGTFGVLSFVVEPTMIEGSFIEEEGNPLKEEVVPYIVDFKIDGVPLPEKERARQ